MISNPLIQRLAKWDLVPLAHFTDHGIRTQASKRFAAPSTQHLSFQIVDGQAQLTPENSLGRNVKADEYLTLAELREVQYTYLKACQKARWTTPMLEMWEAFFFDILSHHSAQNPPVNDQHPLVVYLARTRSRWHSAVIEDPSNPPQLGAIRLDILNTIQADLQALAYARTQADLERRLAQLPASTVRTFSHPLSLTMRGGPALSLSLTCVAALPFTF